jgi:sulfopyruvate decarboxylase TPP-binding subunit
MLAQLQDAGVTHAVTVPDWVQFALHDVLAKPSSGIRNVFAASEDQALTTATGLHVGGARPVVLVQNQGLYKCINTLRATCLDAGVPLVFLVGQFGREADNFGNPTTASRRSMVRLLEPVVDALGIRRWTVDDEADVPRIAEAFSHAKSAETAAVVIVGRHVTWN